MAVHFGDTPSDHAKDLCLTCENCLLVQGIRMRETFKRCSQMRPPWPQYNVTECSAYREKTKMSLYKMEEVAWILTVDKRDRTKVGFRAPETKEYPGLLPKMEY
jgi:hypothetical protein